VHILAQSESNLAQHLRVSEYTRTQSWRKRNLSTSRLGYKDSSHKLEVDLLLLNFCGRGILFLYRLGSCTAPVEAVIEPPSTGVHGNVPPTLYAVCTSTQQRLDVVVLGRLVPSHLGHNSTYIMRAPRCWRLQLQLHYYPRRGHVVSPIRMPPWEFVNCEH
jgi:hypothetical protein